MKTIKTLQSYDYREKFMIVNGMEMRCNDTNKSYYKKYVESICIHLRKWYTFNCIYIQLCKKIF